MEGHMNQPAMLGPLTVRKGMVLTLEWFRSVKVRSKVMVQFFDGILGDKAPDHTAPRDLEAFDHLL